MNKLLFTILASTAAIISAYAQSGNVEQFPYNPPS